MVTFLDILFFTHVRASARDTNFGFFCPIWMKFGIGAKNGSKTWYKFETATAIF